MFPGSIRSGEKARKKSSPAAMPRASKRGSSTSCVVPGYVVDSSTTSWPGRMMAATASAALTMKEMSGSFDLPSGVGTQMMMASQSFSAATSSAAPSRPAATSSPSAAAGTSSMKLRPARMAATRCGSRSAPITLAPDSAKATASGRPT